MTMYTYVCATYSYIHTYVCARTDWMSHKNKHGFGAFGAIHVARQVFASMLSQDGQKWVRVNLPRVLIETNRAPSTGPNQATK
jgi:hypothetical protein